MTNIQALQTPRLLLRAWSEADLPAFAALNADEAVMAHYPRTLKRAESDAYAQVFMERFRSNGWGFWAVSARADSAEEPQDVPPPFLGFVGLNRPDIALPFGPCVEIGWRLARNVWGRGYATEAARACLAFAFEQLALEEVVSFTAIANHRSEAVMRRLGMRRSGNFMHPALPPESPLCEHVLYRLSAHNWCKAKNTLVDA